MSVNLDNVTNANLVLVLIHHNKESVKDVQTFVLIVKMTIQTVNIATLKKGILSKVNNVLNALTKLVLKSR